MTRLGRTLRPRQRMLAAGRLGGLALALSAACSLASCQPSRAAPAPATDVTATNDSVRQAQDIARRLGTALAATADTVVSIHPHDQSSSTIHVHLWCAPDGRIRAICSLHDVDFCSVLLGPGNRYRAWLPRERLATSGVLAADGASPATPSLITAVRLAGEELMSGPLSPTVTLTPGPTPHTVLVAMRDGVSAQVTIDPVNLQVTAKRIFASDGSELLHIVYDRYRTFDELTRPTVVQLFFPDGDQATVLMRTFEGLGSISDTRMALAWPSSTASIELTDFLHRLQNLSN